MFTFLCEVKVKPQGSFGKIEWLHKMQNLGKIFNIHCYYESQQSSLDYLLSVCLKNVEKLHFPFNSKWINEI